MPPFMSMKPLNKGGGARLKSINVCLATLCGIFYPEITNLKCWKLFNNKISNCNYQTVFYKQLSLNT